MNECYKYRSGGKGFCKFLLQQRIVCVCCFMTMLLNNCMTFCTTFSVNMIIFVLRTSLRTESTMNSLRSNSNFRLRWSMLLLVKFSLVLHTVCWFSFFVYLSIVSLCCRLAKWSCILMIGKRLNYSWHGGYHTATDKTIIYTLWYYVYFT